MRQNEKQKKSNSKLLNVVGRKLRALHTAKCRFVSWFTILGHRMAWPTGWMERDQEFFFFIVSIQLHSLHKAFVHLCYVVVIPISHKQRRLRGFYTPDAFFFLFFSRPIPGVQLKFNLLIGRWENFQAGQRLSWILSCFCRFRWSSSNFKSASNHRTNALKWVVLYLSFNQT